MILTKNRDFLKRQSFLLLRKNSAKKKTKKKAIY